MKIKQISVYLCLVLMNTILLGSELRQNIIYRKATQEDARQIIDCLNKHLAEDTEKFIIPPTKFIPDEVRSSIKNGYTFVAYDQQKNTIIGYKNIFLIEGEQSFFDIPEELGFSGDNVQHIDSAYFSEKDGYSTRNITSAIELSFNKKDTHIYLDKDFTDPDYRGRGINKELARIAFESMKEKAISSIKKNQSQMLTLCYGLSYSNDYNLDNKNEKDVYKSRTPGLARSFALFAKSVKEDLNKENSITIYLNRYHTKMPLYEKNSTENVPLDKEHWIASSGNCLSIDLQ